MSTLKERILQMRGTEQKLQPSWSDTRKMKGFTQMIDFLTRLQNNPEIVTIFGDYDADGITSTAMLTYTLRKGLGDDNVRCLLPNRYVHGYGFHMEDADQIPDWSTLILLDNGIKSIDVIEHLNSRGVSVIVIDHHEPGSTLPRAHVIINPKQKDCTSEFKDFCTAGLVLRVCEALPWEVDRGYLYSLAAIGTIGDGVPLLEDNRVMAQEGLAYLQSCRTGPLAELMRAFEIDRITYDDIAFKLCPSINAPGRMGSPYMALELILGNSELVSSIIESNDKRKEATAALMEEYTLYGVSTKFIIIKDDSILTGLAGLLAGKIADLHGKPTLIITGGVGSARSVAGFNIIEALEKYSYLFNRLGGHAGAAGFSIDSCNIEELRVVLEKEITPCPTSIKNYELEIDIADVTLDECLGLESLTPFGEGNPEPIFLLQDVAVLNHRIVGKLKNCTQLVLGSKSLRAIMFSPCDYFPERINVWAKLRVNRYNGYVNPNIEVIHWWE